MRRVKNPPYPIAPSANYCEILLWGRPILLAEETHSSFWVPLIVVVTRRTLALKALMEYRSAPDFRNPRGFRLGAGLD